MKTRIYIASMISLVLLVGCLPTLNPIYRPQDLVFNEALLGEWRAEQGGSLWHFTREDDKTYRLDFTEEDGKSGEFIAHLATIEGVMFLDLMPSKLNGKMPGFVKAHYVPIHTIFMVKSIEPNLVLSSLDLSWLKGYLDENPDALEHARGDRRLITASTEDLQKFLLEHRSQFVGDVTLVRVTPTE